MSSNPFTSRFTRYNIMSYSLQVTCGRSVVFSWYSGFLHQQNWPPQNNKILLKVALNTIIRNLTIYLMSIALVLKASIITTITQLVLITNNIVSSNPAHGEVYSILLYVIKACQWPPRYSWNIVENVVKHHYPNATYFTGFFLFLFFFLWLFLFVCLFVCLFVLLFLCVCLLFFFICVAEWKMVEFQLL